MSEMEERKIDHDPLMQRLDRLGQWIAELQETILQLKAIEASIQELRTIFNSFADGLQQGLAVVQDGNIMWANEVGCRMFGYETEELIGTTGIRLAHPDYREKLAVRLTEIAAGDVWTRNEIWPCVTKNRVDIQIRGYANRIVYGGKPAVMTILVDVTEEQKLQEDLLMQSQMLDSVWDSVFLLDMKGNIKYVNKSACQTLGYTQDEITKMSIMDINPEELKRRVQSRLKMIASEKGGRFMTVHVRKNGSRMQVEVKVKVIEMGHKEFILGIVREIIPEGLQDI
jgi:two-component system cell cycle sensor histidine kinase/response regulator CckA